MYRNWAVRSFLVLVLLLAGAAAAQVTNWDAARDFSGAHNPNGDWTYGWKANNSLVSFTSYQPSPANYPARDAWQDFSQSSLLGVYHNTVGVNGDIPPNMLLLQPDPLLGDAAVLEWTATGNMPVHVQGMFKTLDTAAAQVSVVSSVTGTRFAANVSSANPTASFGLFLTVAAGEKLDFIVSGGAAGVNLVINQLSVLGNASVKSIAATDTRFRVTSNTGNQAGGGWALTKQRFSDGFDTTFLFQIAQLGGGGADGFAFVIQNSSTTALGGTGGSMGYDPIPASLAIEFDTYANLNLSDPNGNHISVHTLGVAPNSSLESASRGRSGSIPNMKDGNWHLIHVRYDVQPKPQLSIYMDTISAPVVQVALDIVATLQLADGTAWVGFTGGTGGATEVHDIQNWHFSSSDLHPPVLSLPSPAPLEGNTKGGATVAFTASAMDAVDGARAVTCTPASGQVFPVGSTTVTCSATDLSGNTATGSFVVTVTDKTPPTITVPLSATAPAQKAFGAAMTYAVTATDIVDGDLIPLCSPAAGSIFPIGQTTVTCTATDRAGNGASASFIVNVTDEVPPVISGLVDVAVEATGPQTVVSWTGLSATDNVDGAVPVVCNPASGSQFAVGNTTVQCSATDAAGNRATGSFVVMVEDTTPPVISPTADITAEATSPAGAVVSWTAPTATDLLDGAVPVTCSPASASTFSLGLTTVSCSAVDAHGNRSSKTFRVKVQDTVSPVISCGTPDGLWHAADVAIACTAHDGGSGLANAADASFSLVTNVAAGAETAVAATNSRRVCDAAGNCVTAGPIGGNAVDKQAPVITITTPAAATYILHQPVTASYSCVDRGSGVAACNGTVASGAAVDTSSAGARQFTVTASDNVGNAASAAVRYSVGYNLCLLSSGDAKQSGSTIPVRLALCDYAGKNVSSPALDVVAVGIVGADGAQLQAAGNANPGMRFRYLGAAAGGAYMLDLKTTGFLPGTYELLVRVSGDPAAHPVIITTSSRKDAHQ